MHSSWEKCLTKLDTNTIVNLFDYDEIDMHFFNKNKITLMQLVGQKGDIQTLAINNTRVYLATRKIKQLKLLDGQYLSFNLICDTAPSWLMIFNINNWIECVSLWRLWLVTSSE